MAFIDTIAPADATGEVEAMYRRQQNKFGYVPNYAKVFCHRPELMKLWADLQVGIRRHVDPRRFELVTLAAAHALGSSYCSLAHGKLLTEHYPAEQVQRIASEADPAPLTPAERAMVRYARKVARDASSVTADDVAELKAQGLTDAEIFDIAAMAAGRAFLSKLVDGLGAEPDAAYLEVDEGLRAALTVGRPIDEAAPERLPEPAEAPIPAGAAPG
ncbi:MAG TPA: peroxidase-related enzyme [Pseudomonadales bacterium]